jgi:hypothetical protein
MTDTQSLSERLRMEGRGTDMQDIACEAADALDQAAAALTLVTEWWDEDGPHRAEPDMVAEARKALAAIRKKHDQH